ncbi:MAG: hypothetical protein KDD45_06595, partial [Bdellovibrionales bacterium]|nr:hypothetical protein [Bdellovibrionales bacterium]
HSKNICLNSAEKELFEKLILPKSKENKKIVIIAYALYGRMDPIKIISHEVMHAQYFTSLIYKSIVDSFWQTEVSKEDKLKIKKILGRYYDSSNELLVKNEFQAYILMSGAESGLLSAFLDEYRKPLTEALIKAHAPPIQLESSL